MGLLNITAELEKSIAELMNHSLLSKGLAALNTVNTVVSAVQNAKATAIEQQNQLTKVAEQVAQDVTPVVQEAKKVARKYKKK